MKEQKKILRQRMKWLWRILAEEERLAYSKQAETFSLCPLFQKAKHIAIFSPLAWELDFFSTWLKNFPQKQFYFPVLFENHPAFIAGERIEQWGWKNGKSPENFSPQNLFAVEKMDLLFLPALALDKEGFRLGQGGGFYDRVLQKNKNVLTLTLLPKFAFFPILPREDWDQAVKICIFTDGHNPFEIYPQGKACCM